MNKDFDHWNEEKKSLDKKSKSPFYREREIWWCAVGVNVGVEINGKGDDFGRPVLVLKGFNKDSFLGVFLTGRKRKGDYYVYVGEIDKREASVNLSQIRVIDTKRLINRKAILDKETFKEIRKAVKNII